MLLEVSDGVDKVIRPLAYPHKRKPNCGPLTQELGDFRRNCARMDYARLRAQNWPIGSGVVEASCKTLAPSK